MFPSRRDRKEVRVLMSRDHLASGWRSPHTQQRTRERLSAQVARAVVRVNLRGATVWSALRRDRKEARN